MVFCVSPYTSKSKSGMSVPIGTDVVTQHSRDQELLEGLGTYLDCGKYSKRRKEAF